MNAQFAPEQGTLIHLEPYEGELAIRLIRTIVRELEKEQIDASDFKSMIVSIATKKVRKQ